MKKLKVLPVDKQIEIIEGARKLIQNNKNYWYGWWEFNDKDGHVDRDRMREARLEYLDTLIIQLKKQPKKNNIWKNLLNLISLVK